MVILIIDDNPGDMRLIEKFLTGNDGKDEILPKVLLRSIRYAINWKNFLLNECNLRKQLMEEHDKLLTLIDNITDEIWFCDKKANIVLFNKSAFKGLGLENREDLLHNLHDLINNLQVYNLDDTVRNPEDSPLLRSLQGEVLDCFEEKVRNLRTGEIKYRQVNSAPLREERNGEIIGAIAVVRDITKQKRTEEGLWYYKNIGVFKFCTQTIQQVW